MQYDCGPSQGAEDLSESRGGGHRARGLYLKDIVQLDSIVLDESPDVGNEEEEGIKDDSGSQKD